MTRLPLLSRLIVAASALCVPLLAQTPLFTDGTAFGGSKVFSEGLNPRGNWARTSQAPDGYFFSYVDGNQRAQDNKSILANTASANPTAATAALGQLANAPWALGTKAYGLSAVKSGSILALTREELNGMIYNPGWNQFLDGRRAVVDRLSLGGGGPVQTGLSLGFGIRVESWELGEQTATFSTPGGFGNPESSLMGLTSTSGRTLTYGLDGGLTYDLATGVRLGVAVDQLNAKTLGDVSLKPQFRGGLQIDLGQQTKLSIESDLNAVELMPVPVKQQSSSASLRYAVSSTVVFLVGAEQRKVDGASVTRGGATLQIRTDSLLLGFGFQASQDSPMKSATLGFH